MSESSHISQNHVGRGGRVLLTLALPLALVRRRHGAAASVRGVAHRPPAACTVSRRARRRRHTIKRRGSWSPWSSTSIARIRSRCRWTLSVLPARGEGRARAGGVVSRVVAAVASIGVIVRGWRGGGEVALAAQRLGMGPGSRSSRGEQLHPHRQLPLDTGTRCRFRGRLGDARVSAYARPRSRPCSGRPE